MPIILTLLIGLVYAAACGLSLKQSVLSKFKQVINQYARESFDVIAYREVIWHDGPLSPEDFTVDFVEKIQSLRPWGMGFQSLPLHKNLK